MPYPQELKRARAKSHMTIKPEMDYSAIEMYDHRERASSGITVRPEVKRQSIFGEQRVRALSTISIRPEKRHSVAPESLDQTYSGMTVRPDKRNSIYPDKRSSIYQDKRNSVYPERRDSVFPNRRDTTEPSKRNSVYPNNRARAMSTMPEVEEEKYGSYAEPAPKRGRSRKFWCLLIGGLIFIIGVAVGLGVGLSQRSKSSNSNTAGGVSSNTTTDFNGTIWQPAAGSKWQIVLLYPLNDTTPDVPIYNIDLFTNPASTIATLHSLNRKVICYFSAGTYENFRPDSSSFQSSDYRNPLADWPGEFWLDTTSANVRKIMLTRLDMAVSKGCDGVDPDNVDGFANTSGFALTEATGADYMAFLANAAHSRGLSIGLKNALDLVDATLPLMQWQVNEQCVQFNECDRLRPYIAAGKPVFQIEYPTAAAAPNVVTTAKKASICNQPTIKGFSTLLKNMKLDNWYDTC